MERAGFTEVLVDRDADQIMIGAKPAGARPWVAPMITTRNTAVSTTSHRNAAATV